MDEPLRSNSRLIAGVGLADLPRKSRWPARMDLLQSVSGLFLGLFMWGHMFFVASILISEEAMWTVTKMFEGYFVFGRGYPVLVSGVVAAVFIAFVLHAFLAMRKFPASYRQYRAFIGHRKLFRHTDTTLWWVQAVTGFVLFFLGSAHLYQMLMNPGDIGPYASGERVYSSWWPLYLVLLFAVELHGGIGLYRLAVKWGWLEGKHPDASRRRLSLAKWGLTAFFLVLGLLTLVAYYRIGWSIRDEPGIRYLPEGTVVDLSGEPR
ncbi:MAG: fumarate reductase cytochrome b subunit [Pseudomonadales bacterium]